MNKWYFAALFLCFSCSGLQNEGRNPASFFKSCYELIDSIRYGRYELPDTSSKNIHDNFLHSTGNKRLDTLLKRGYKSYRNDKDLLNFTKYIAHRKENQQIITEGLVDARLRIYSSSSRVVFDFDSLMKQGYDYTLTQKSSGIYNYSDNTAIVKMLLSTLYVAQMKKQDFPDIKYIEVNAREIVNRELATQLMKLGFVRKSTGAKVSEQELDEVYSFMERLPKRPLRPKRENFENDTEYSKAKRKWKRAANRWSYHIQTFFEDLELKEGENNLTLSLRMRIP